ncbi:hypothetical protein EJB05_48729, partial [Eragrostis curvula]
HSVSMHNGSSSLYLNNEYKHQLDVNSGCHLPDVLKLKICKLLDDNSISSSLSLRMDVSSLSTLSDEMRACFSTLLEHAYSVDLRTQNVVLKLLKLLCDAVPNDFVDNTQTDVRAAQSVSNDDNPPSRLVSDENIEDTRIPDLPSHRSTPGSGHLMCNNTAQTRTDASNLRSTQSVPKVNDCRVSKSVTPHFPKAKITPDQVEKLIHKLQKHENTGKCLASQLAEAGCSATKKHKSRIDELKDMYNEEP